MNIVTVKDLEALSHRSAEFIAQCMRSKPQINLGLATGSTPEATYNALVKAHRAGHLSFRNASTFNLDEYVDIEITDEQSYHYYMYNKLFRHVDIDLSRTHIPTPKAPYEQSCRAYEQLLRDHPIDLQLLGVGANGHIGFNEPFADPKGGVHLVALHPQTRKDNARFFGSEAETPTHAMTMGIGNIMAAKKILLLVNHPSKRAALRALLSGKKDLAWPVTALIDHPDVTVMVPSELL